MCVSSVLTHRDVRRICICQTIRWGSCSPILYWQFSNSCVLNFAVAEEIVPGQAGTVGNIGTWHVGKIGTAVFTETVRVKHGYIFVAPAVAGVQRVVDIIAYVIVECTERSDA
mgnify:FL=1